MHHPLPYAMIYVLEPKRTRPDYTDDQHTPHRITVNGKAYDYDNIEQALQDLGRTIEQSQPTPAEEENRGRKR